MKLDFIDMTNLKTSPINVRKHGEINGDDLVPSIRSLGVVQPLLVRPTRGVEGGHPVSDPTGKQKCSGFEVIAGQRRFHACQTLAAERDEQGEDAFPAIPCAIMEDGDDAKAIEASLAENIARLPMDELDQYEAFRALAKQGQTIEEIAAHFGVTERLVKQRLAIANLYAPILNAYRREEVDPTAVRILTMATTKQQKAWFKLFKSDDDYAPTGYRLKSWLFGGDQILTSSALFDLDAYKGTIITDLFGDEGYFADSAAFWEYQSQAIAEMIEDYRQDGWSDVILLDVGEQWSSWEHVDTAKEDGGKVFIRVAQNGEVTSYVGQLSRSDIKKRDRAINDGNEADKADRPELTKPMQNYLALHRHAAVRAELLNHQGIALRLAVAQIIAGSTLWDIKADPQKANSEAIRDSLESNTAEDLFAQERLTVRGLLELEDDGDDNDTQSVVPKKADWDARRDCHAIFARLVELDDAAVNRILTFLVAETLSSGTAMVEALGVMMNVDMSNHWNVEDTSAQSVFFDLLRDKEAINTMVKEVAGKPAADGNLTATAKVQKDIIKACLSGERETKINAENWQPRYMAFPMDSYTNRSGIQAVEQWNSVKGLFEAAQ